MLPHHVRGTIWEVAEEERLESDMAFDELETTFAANAKLAPGKRRVHALKVIL